MKPEYTIMDNGNYMVYEMSPDGMPMFIEMTPEQYNNLYGT